MLDTPPPKADIATLMAAEARFQLTAQQDASAYEALVDRARDQVAKRFALFKELARPAQYGHSRAG